MKLNLLKTLTLLIILNLTGGYAMAESSINENMDLLGKFSNHVFVNKDLTNLETFMHTDYIQHNPFVDQGISGFREFFKDWFTSIPDFNYELQNIIANEEYVWVYGTYKGTHTNTWLGIEASNQAYAFNAVDIFRIEDGKLAEHWDVLDLQTLFKQLQASN